MDLDACTRHLDVVDEESEELLTLVEVEPVDADSRSLGEIGDSSLQAVVGRQLLSLGDLTIPPLDGHLI